MFHTVYRDSANATQDGRPRPSNHPDAFDLSPIAGYFFPKGTPFIMPKSHFAHAGSQHWQNCKLHGSVNEKTFKSRDDALETGPMKRQESNISPSSLLAKAARERRIGLFQESIQQFSEMAAREGISIAPHCGELRHFPRLDDAQQESILQRFSTYLDICKIVTSDGFLKDDTRMVWTAIKRMRLRPPSDLFSLLSDDDIVEIFDIPGHFQLFRNVRYFHVSSYTLDDLLSRPWYELFYRDQAVTDHIFATSHEITQSGSAARTRFLDIGEHSLDEIDSIKRFHCIVENRFIAPLHDAHGQVAAQMVVTRAVSVTSRAGASDGD